MKNTWFVIVNPISGNKNFKKNWTQIQQLFSEFNISFSYKLTTHSGHEEKLVVKAIKKGFTRFISVGGDGTLHHITNGIMHQQLIETTAITLAVIPLGTGNDWVKNYHISKKLKENIQLIQQEKIILQDIGLIETATTKRYFTTLGGIGYDAYVVHKLKKLKKFGAIAYLLSGVIGLLSYKKSKFKVEINNKTIETTCLMVLFGNCKFTGGGMCLTDYKNTTDGLFDVSIFKELTFWDLVLNMKKLYDGTIIHHKKVSSFTSKKITVTPLDKKSIPFIQADGELIGSGKVTTTLIPKALNFIIK